jgi:hypothetical protein
MTLLCRVHSLRRARSHINGINAIRACLLASGVGLWGAGVYATGVGGFVPNDQNVVMPTTSQVTTVWKQTGACGASAVQIAPSWVLSANHAHCSQGTYFYRQDGARELVDREAPTMPGQIALQSYDLHLAHLAHPLPYAGNFVPLVDNLLDLQYAPSSALVQVAPGNHLSIDGNQLSVCSSSQVLMAGNSGGFKVGWVPLFAAYQQLSRLQSSNPNVATPLPGGANGDSGGPLFVFNDALPQGALFAIFHVAGTNLEFGFPAGVREQINAVLADAGLNPTGEQLQWVDALKAYDLGAGQLPPPPTLFSSEGAVGPLDANGVPGGGWTFNYNIYDHRNQVFMWLNAPDPISCQGAPNGSAPATVDAYRVYAIPVNAPSDTVPLQFTTTSANPKLILDGITPGQWNMAISTLRLDPNTQGYLQSPIIKKATVTMPTKMPTAVSGVDISYYSYNVGDGLPHWMAFLTANFVDPIWTTPATDTAWKIAFPSGSDVSPSGTYQIRSSVWTGVPNVFMIFDTNFPNAAPGDVITLSVVPEAGVARGSGRTIYFTVPDSSKPLPGCETSALPYSCPQ